MLIAEVECNLHACPEARVSYIDNSADIGLELGGGMNRMVRIKPGESPEVHYVPLGAGCIGQMCMAWRTAPRDKRFGYCGKAGLPTELMFETVETKVDPQGAGSERYVADAPYINGGSQV